MTLERGFTTYVGIEGPERYAVVEYRPGLYETDSLYTAEVLHRAETIEEAVGWLHDTVQEPGRRRDVVAISEQGHLAFPNPDEAREIRDLRHVAVRP